MSLFFVVTVVIGYGIYKIYKQESIKKLRGVCYCLLFCMTLLRCLYFATDPMAQTNDIPYYLEQLIFGFGFFFMLVSYLLVVLFWASVYHGERTLLSRKSNQQGQVLVKKTRFVFAIVAFILFGFEFTERTVYGLKILSITEDPLLDTLYDIYLAVVSLGISGGMCIYGSLTYRKMRKSSLQFGTDMTRIVKLTSITIVISATLFVAVVALLVIVALNALTFPTGAIASFTIDHLLELILSVEMLYLMKPPKLRRKLETEMTSSTIENQNALSSPSTAVIKMEDELIHKKGSSYE